jgi:hypothetical protein
MDDSPGSDSDSNEAPGSYNEEHMLGSESPWWYSDTESDARGPDPYYNNPPDDDFFDESDLESDGVKSEVDDGTNSDNDSDESRPTTGQRLRLRQRQRWPQRRLGLSLVTRR